MNVQYAYTPHDSQISESAPSEVTPLLEDPLLARAMTFAGVGAWSCNLPDEKLTWTAGVYELFGLPAGTPLDRRRIVEMYTEGSRETMQRLRAHAVAQGGAFTLDAQIVRADGDLRWMRLTGEMIGRNGQTPRLYGLKQDITEERLRWEAMRRLAENDALTGLASRAVYESRFLARPRTAGSMAPLGALILFDMDEFKAINDRFGHAAGDTCLRAFAERLSASFPEALLTARIGGDEFAMILGESARISLQSRVARFRKQLRAPVLWQGHTISIAASTGTAVPHDPYSYDAEELFVIADAALYSTKKRRRLMAKEPSARN